MTEEEARTKDCFVTFNRPETEGGAELCIGSSCMAWRWETEWDDGKSSYVPRQVRGYCGLAGRP